jgi:S1-C subfamily serine protease
MFCSTCVGTGGEPGPTDLFKPDAILIATSVGSEPRVTLHVPATAAQGSWGVGDVVPGLGRIERIGFVSVDVADGNRRATLSLFDRIPGGRSDAGAATPAPAAADPFADRIRKIDDRTYEVDRNLVRELLGGSASVGSGRLAPVTKDGKLVGLRLSGVRPGSIAAAIGARNGDVFEAVNNERIESANTLLGVYAQLEQLSAVELAGTRAGKPLTLTLRLH